MTENVDMSAAQVQAARLAARANIRDVRMFQTTVEVKRFPSSASLTYSLEIAATTEYEPGDESFVVRLAYSLTISEGGTDADGDAELFDASFVLGGLFSLDDEEPDRQFDQGELEAYAQTTGQFALYPYAREYVQDITGRCGFPPLTLDVLRLPSPYHAPEEAAARS